jgi:hypothetical protein
MAWQQFMTEIERRPAQILVDERFQTFAPVPELPRLAWLAVYCRKRPEIGFWDPIETAALDAIENDLIGLWDTFGRGWAVYVARIATRGLREYFLYFGAAAEPASALPSLRAAHPGYQMEFEEKNDAEWLRYRSLLQLRR